LLNPCSYVLSYDFKSLFLRLSFLNASCNRMSTELPSSIKHLTMSCPWIPVMITSGKISFAPPFTFSSLVKPKKGRFLSPFGTYVAACTSMSWESFLLALPLVAFRGAANPPMMVPKNTRLFLVSLASLWPFIPPPTTLITFLGDESSHFGERIFLWDSLRRGTFRVESLFRFSSF
jgi:hypothetical protein